LLEALSAENPDNQPARREVGFGYYQLGNTLLEAHDYAAALESWRKAFGIREQVAAKDPKNAQARFDLAVDHADLAEVLTATGATDEALAHAREALSILQQLSDADPTNAVYWRNIGLCYEKFANAFASLGATDTKSRAERIRDWSEARAWFERALGVFLNLRDRGTLMPADSEQNTRFQRKIQDCDAAVAHLNM